MERKRTQRFTASDRLRNLLSVPSSSQPVASSSFELDESDLFDPSLSPSPPVRTPTLNTNTNPVPIPFSRRSAFPRPPEGMLAVLPSTTAGTSASVSSSPSSSSSSPSSSRMILAIPKPKRELPQAYQYQSAPVNVPVVPSRLKSRRDSIFLVEEELEEKSEEEGENEMILPPHEIVARSRAKESPLTTFSVLEGAGRTLKGRDLRQVRNAVWRKTGFID